MQPCRYEPRGAEFYQIRHPCYIVPLTFFCAKIILINRTETLTEEASLCAGHNADGSRV